MDDPASSVPVTLTDDEKTELQSRLTSLKAQATKEDALKNYAAAAEHYSQATEIQSQLNGEMSVENADLLYLYGRCLYQVAVSKSDVLGGKVASEEPRKRKRDDMTGETATSGAVKNGASSTDSSGHQSSLPKSSETEPKAAYLQIEGDENWLSDDADDVQDGAEGDAPAPDEEAQDEEDDDLATAYEILDVARVLLTRKFDQAKTQSQQELTASDDKGKGPETTPTLTPSIRAVMERLADTRDLQADISLENERWLDAIADEGASLALKQELYPPESSLIAEAHFKLSLALEFASVTTIAADAADPDGADVPDAVGQIDQGKRDEAVAHMDKAIESCQARVSKEKSALEAEEKGSEKHALITKSIEDVEDMIKDMETRLVDLRNPAVSVNGNDAGGAGGFLESLMGATPAQQKAKIEQATKSANDLTSIVRHKKPKTEAAASSATAADVSSGKRKADDALENGDVNGKRTKVEENA